MRTLVFLLISLNLFSVENIHPGNVDSMNGISLKKFLNFEKKWKLVTVRYREDSQEMRFVYANKIAYQSLLKGKDLKFYPKGAVFAKIGLKTERDSNFYSSVVPSGAKRIQFMEKDPVKYKSTNGWTYALFNSQGKTFPGDPEENTTACHACHIIAKDKDYVFSELADLTSTKVNKQHEVVKSNILESVFYDVYKSSFPKVLSDLKLKNNKFRKYIGPLVSSNFQGTADEIIPTLIEEVKRTGISSFYISDSQKYFSMVDVESSDESCARDQKKIVIYKSLLVPKENGSSVADFEITSDEKCI